MGKETEKCSASKLYTLGNLYIRYILNASMHCVSRELAQHKIMYELFYWLLKWTSLESFFLSRFLFIFSFSCFAKCLSLMQINVEAILHQYFYALHMIFSVQVLCLYWTYIVCMQKINVHTMICTFWTHSVSKFLINSFIRWNHAVCQSIRSRDNNIFGCRM